MKKSNLPISPHLQIYKPQITSVLSITHRITGFCLNFLLIFFVTWITCLAYSESAYNFFLIFISSLPARIICVFSILGFTFHSLNGIRHIIWDLGYCLEIKKSTILGYIILFLSLCITCLISIKIGLL